MEGLLSTEGYNQKLQELTTAKQECLGWISKSSQDRIQERIAIDRGYNKPIRLYSSPICIGPCTCWDKICGSPSLCVEIYGTQSCPITCDVLMYIGYAIFCLIGYWPDIKAGAERREKERQNAAQQAQREREIKERETRRKKAEDAKQKNAILRQQLDECQNKKESTKKHLEESKQGYEELKRCIALFNALGVADQSIIRIDQEAKIEDIATTLDNYSQQEKVLLRKIEQNQTIIDEELH